MERGIELLDGPSMAAAPLEIVERKGIGHPDTICDAIVEAVAVRLARGYLDATGRMAPMNVDKALLAAGQAAPALGGGRVTTPLRFILGGRAHVDALGGAAAVEALAVETARAWLRDHLRFLDPDRHVVFQSELRPSAGGLLSLFDATSVKANDTSVGAGFAPLSPVEETVLAVEEALRTSLQAEFPSIGEDVKVMATRRDDALALTLAIAFVDRFVPTVAQYVETKDAITARVRELVVARDQFRSIDVRINTLDDASAVDGLYLTVTGTSGEHGDDGQVGRGNRVSGLIPFGRPMSLEAAAGKNPASHVGKIYNVLAHDVAAAIVAAVPEVEEALVWLVSRIGSPLPDPHFVRIAIRRRPGRADGAVRADVDDAARVAIAKVGTLVDDLVAGRRRVY